MTDIQKKLLLGKLNIALTDRHIGKVAKAIGMSRITVSKARDGAESITASSITALCGYLGIEIPTPEPEKDAP